MITKYCTYEQHNIKILSELWYVWVWSCSAEPVGESARAHAALPLPAENGMHQQWGELNTAVKADVALDREHRCAALSGSHPQHLSDARYDQWLLVS